MASPFAAFRRHQKVLLAVTGILAMIAFVFLGPALDYLVNTQRGQVQNPVVVKWRYGEIHRAQFENQRRLRHQVNAFLAAAYERAVSTGAKPSRQPLQLAVDDESMVRIMLLAQRARELGIVVGDVVINDYLKEITANSLTSDNLQSLLRSISQGGVRIGMEHIFEALRTEFLARQLGSTFDMLHLAEPPAQRFEYYAKLERRARIEAAGVSVADFVAQVPSPSEGELVAFYEAHKNTIHQPVVIDNVRLDSPDPGFKQPARSRFQFVKADFEALVAAEKASVTDDAVRQYYEINKEMFRRTSASELLSPSTGNETAPQAPASSAPPSQEGSESQPPANGAGHPVQETSGTPAGSEFPPAQTDAGPARPGGSVSVPEQRQNPGNAPLPLPGSSDVEVSPASTGLGSEEPATGDQAPEARAPVRSQPLASERASSTRWHYVGAVPTLPVELRWIAQPLLSWLAGQTNKPSSDQDNGETSLLEPGVHEQSVDEAEATPARKNGAEGDAGKAAAQPAADGPDGDEITSATGAAHREPSGSAPEPSPTAPPSPEQDNGDTSEADLERLFESLGDEPTPTTPTSGAYETLEEVADRVRGILASQQVREKIATEFGKVQAAIRRYHADRAVWESQRQLKDGKEGQAPAPPQIGALVTAAGFTFGETPLLSAIEFYEHTELGKSFRAVSGPTGTMAQPLVNTAFGGTMDLYAPLESQDMSGNEFISWKTEHQEAFVPPLEEIRGQVEYAWRAEKARELARRRAEELLAKVPPDKSLKEALASEPGLTLIEAGPFSWLTRGSAALDPRMAPPVRLEQLESIPNVGPQFMRTVFSLQAGQRAVAENHPKNMYYVVRVISMEPPENALRSFFMSENYLRYATAGSADRMNLVGSWLDQLKKQTRLETHFDEDAAPNGR